MDIVDILDQLQFVFITMAEFDYEIYEMGIKLGLIERNSKKRIFEEEMKRLELKKDSKVTTKRKQLQQKQKLKKLQLKRKQLQLKKEQPKEKIVRIFKNIIKTVDLFYTKSFAVFSF